MLKRHRLGRDGEALAADRLVTLGYEILGRRFACRRGDIDIVCRRNDAVFLVEVKTRSGPGFGGGAEAITATKLHSLAACSAEYRAMTGWRGPIHLLLALVRLGYDGEEARVELLADALA